MAPVAVTVYPQVGAPGQTSDVALPVDAFAIVGLPVAVLCKPAALSATVSV